MKRYQTGFLLMILAATMLAFATLLMKQIPQITILLPKDVAIWRFSIATPLLWLFYFLKQGSNKKLPGSPWRFLGLGCAYALANFCAVFALARLASSLYVIIVFIYPSLVVLFSLLTGGRVPKLYWLGLPLTLIGLLLITNQLGSDLVVNPLGLVITVLNAVAMATYFILSERLFRNINQKFLGTNWVMTGAMIAGLLMIPFLQVQTPGSVLGWLYLISLSIFGTLIPILAMNFGLQLVGAARGSVVITLQPILTVLISTIFLGERLSILQWIGGILVITAVVMLQLSPDKGNKPVSSKSD